MSSCRGAGTGGLGLAIEGPSEAKMSCKDNKDGSCTVEYIPFTAGDYDVNITFGGRPIPGVQRGRWLLEGRGMPAHGQEHAGKSDGQIHPQSRRGLAWALRPLQGGGAVGASGGTTPPVHSQKPITGILVFCLGHQTSWVWSLRHGRAARTCSVRTALHPLSLSVKLRSSSFLWAEPLLWACLQS